MRINFGCGRRVLDGFFNIDAVRNPKAPRSPELLHAVTFTPEGKVVQAIPLKDGCADELQALHVIEHVFAWEAPALLAEWKRLLKPGGLLVLELPNLEAAARNLLEGMSDQMCMWPLYGDPSHRDTWMCHKWGYTPSTMKALLHSAGFLAITQTEPRTHGPRPDRDMRFEAIRSP